VFFLCFLRAYPTFSTNWSSSIFTVSVVRFRWLWRNDEHLSPHIRFVLSTVVSNSKATNLVLFRTRLYETVH
jgi:hypothetical protein